MEGLLHRAGPCRVARAHPFTGVVITPLALLLVPDAEAEGVGAAKGVATVVPRRCPLRRRRQPRIENVPQAERRHVPWPPRRPLQKST